MENNEYLSINRDSWNKRTEHHFDSDFYDVKGFIKGKSSLNNIELSLLGDIRNKEALHLQCHFGQDTISLTRLGALATGIDLSDQAIQKARELAKMTNSKANFKCSDVYGLPDVLDKKYDLVFTSYGTIGWLPDINRWAQVIAHFLNKGGQLIFVEFHPLVWMFDDDFTSIKYSYFNGDAIIENTVGTYANKNADIKIDSVSWNHGLGEVINSLIKNGVEINDVQEYDYSPYDCFNHTIKVDPNKYRIKHLREKIPMVYSIKATKK